MIRRRTLAFTGVLAASGMIVSIAAFTGVLAAGGSPHLATLLRLAISAPILYFGLRPLGDPLRVALAVGTITGAKLALEPMLATLLLDSKPVLAPLIGDLFGAIILFAMLRHVRHRVFAIA